MARRTNLVLHFVCSECGGMLAMSDVHPGDKTKGCESPQLPTGALKLTAGTVAVEPCQRCVKPVHDAARMIRRGLDQLTRD